MTSPDETIRTCIQMLQNISEDSTIPRNIRRVADETKTVLQDESRSIGLRAATAISLIDEISNDPNMPVHARTRIWELVSQTRNGTSRLSNLFFLNDSGENQSRMLLFGVIATAVSFCSPCRVASRDHTTPSHRSPKNRDVDRSLAARAHVQFEEDDLLPGAARKPALDHGDRDRRPDHRRPDVGPPVPITPCRIMSVGDIGRGDDRERPTEV